MVKIVVGVTGVNAPGLPPVAGHVFIEHRRDDGQVVRLGGSPAGRPQSQRGFIQAAFGHA